MMSLYAAPLMCEDVTGLRVRMLLVARVGFYVLGRHCTLHTGSAIGTIVSIWSKKGSCDMMSLYSAPSTCQDVTVLCVVECYWSREWASVC